MKPIALNLMHESFRVGDIVRCRTFGTYGVVKEMVMSSEPESAVGVLIPRVQFPPSELRLCDPRTLDLSRHKGSDVGIGEEILRDLFDSDLSG